jgi:hypothetical protein
MIPVIAGYGAMTGQLVSRQAWQHEAWAAIANVRTMQAAGASPETSFFADITAGVDRLRATIAKLSIRLHLTAPEPLPAGKVRS